jgi:hypothetical protein
MLRRHIACQWSEQVARFIRIKCRGRVAQRPYVRLRPLAYVTGGRPRGSIGSPPVWGAEAYMTWPGHVSAPDPCLGLIKARVLPLLGSRDSVCDWPSPPPPPPGGGARAGGVGVSRGGCGPRLEVRSVYLGVQHWRSGPTVDTLEYIVSSSYVAAPEPPTRWGRALFCHVTRDSRMDSTPSYCSKGYP